jgi:prenyltransferase beta subunit
MSQLTDQMIQSADWLREAQDDEGGWGETPGAQHLSSLNTAEAIIALISTDRERAGTDAVQRGIAFLRKHQSSVPPNAGAWMRDAKVEGTQVETADVVRTGLILEALVLADIERDDPMITGAVDWLIDVQNEEGGWGPTRDKPTQMLPTCQALLGLLAVHDQDDEIPPSIARGVEYVLGCQRPAGFFGCDEIASHLAAPHTIYALLVLQAARAQGIVSDSKSEEKGIDWLLASQDDAKRLVCEPIELTPENRYDFLYVTDSLLIRVLNNSKRNTDAKSLLYRASLYSVKDRIEPAKGACFGYRPFTWSTARAIAGMSAAATTETTFPSRPAEYSVGPRVRWWLTALMLLILGGAAVLAFFGTFSPQVFGFFALVVFVLLLLSRVIGVDLFERLAQSALGGRGTTAARNGTANDADRTVSRDVGG